MNPLLALSDKGKAPAVVSPFSAAAAGETLPWVEKYRPTQLDELISHTEIINTINRFIETNRFPHLLLYGPPGNGKTSTILACAQRLYGKRYKSMTLELNASDDRGIDVVREQIKSFASTKMIFSSGFKLIILDEADAMTQAAQAALRRIIEKYTANVRFCLICNYVGKIIPALQSRCTRFRFGPLQLDQIAPRLDAICSREGVTMTPEGRDAVLRVAKGDMRRVLNVLQSAHAVFDTVDEAAIYATVGQPLPEDVQRIVQWLFSEQFTTAYHQVSALKTQAGMALADLITDIYTTVMAMDVPDAVRVYILDKLSEIEYDLSVGCSEKAQTCALVGVFRVAVDLAERHAKSPTASASAK
ncbi:hypothetical protein CXG81DRAFT_15267 [Caulochytrium protostelioides]|uniref:AAA+ ATPase domain-containing protein n=1 Tax=Caulochytrium protostelioides TaxID=1555241 RepID=A0A4P9X1H6_9FUNG|nr:hypothetical protein CXG81DRAFT_15267 [Caulochytrium protostelioides]|eukprot:RKO98925.1 hypothetical protein CXG81DRAFT_15267 [Caulochytrium protostelioides]